MDNIQRWKLLGSILFNQGKDAYIKKINGDIHFCEIKILSEDYLIVENFAPEQRAGKTDKIYWVQIIEFDEYKGENYKKFYGNDQK